jgi:hypothetical protein
MRFDFEHLPVRFHQDANNVSARFGIAFQVTPAWVIRSGYGIFFDRYVLASLNPAIQKDGRSAFEQVLSGNAAAAAFQSASGGIINNPIGRRESIGLPSRSRARHTV